MIQNNPNAQQSFLPDYHERLLLADGTSADLRLVRPEDKALLAEGLRHLSPESSYRRFFTIKQRLTEHELRYLTELDQKRHVAIGATRKREDGSIEGLGVARFICIDAAGSIAEPAIAVVDHAQGLGLGKALLRRLMDAARERGVHIFRSEVLAGNDPIKGLLAELGPLRVVDAEAGVVTLDMSLDPSFPEADPAAERGALEEQTEQVTLFRLLSLAAQGLLSVRRTFHWLVGHHESEG